MSVHSISANNATAQAQTLRPMQAAQQPPQATGTAPAGDPRTTAAKAPVVKSREEATGRLIDVTA